MQLNRPMPPNDQPPMEVKYNRIVCSKRKRTTEFLPLEVWRARGFATQLIVENTTPDYIKEHPQLGKLYGVSLDVEDEVFESSIWEGQARIRVQLSAAHQPTDIDRAVAAFVKVRDEMAGD